jgi:surface protein
MFLEAAAFNSNISCWNVSNVTEMSRMFRFAEAFNQDVSSWKMCHLGMSPMPMPGLRCFEDAYSFNQNLSRWDVSNVRTMDKMFDHATRFDQDVDSWGGCVGFFFSLVIH